VGGGRGGWWWVVVGGVGWWGGVVVVVGGVVSPPHAVPPRRAPYDPKPFRRACASPQPHPPCPHHLALNLPQTKRHTERRTVHLEKELAAVLAQAQGAGYAIDATSAFELASQGDSYTFSVGLSLRVGGLTMHQACLHACLSCRATQVDPRPGVCAQACHVVGARQPHLARWQCCHRRPRHPRWSRDGSAGVSALPSQVEAAWVSIEVAHIMLRALFGSSCCSRSTVVAVSTGERPRLPGQASSRVARPTAPAWHCWAGGRLDTRLTRVQGEFRIQCTWPGTRVCVPHACPPAACSPTGQQACPPACPPAHLCGCMQGGVIACGCLLAR